MTRSLSGRLLIGVVALVLVALVVADSATYILLRNSLLSRVDAQLTSRPTQDTARTVIGNDCHLLGPGSPDFPTNTVAELISQSGTVLVSCSFRPFGSSSTPPAPELPRALTNAGTDHPAPPFTVDGTGAVGQYRVTDWPEDSFNGSFIVFAIPIDDINSTLSQLLLLEALIGAVAVAGIAVLALLIIRIGLRPLARMGAVAEDIAKGD
ncbi:MAG TPA: hypothetical protein VKT20_11795, partial [Candidatus Dormibacteraeota bacterium]|nr:hypothetical protein [Candidatus Dormibacteraeota bacterium]